MDERGRISTILNRCCACVGRSKASPRILLNHELGPREFRKTATLGDKFIESSAFDHASGVEYEDFRGVADGGKPVRDHGLDIAEFATISSTI